jgi:hypothetical protein
MLPKRNWWRLGISVLAFHFLRHFPAWVGWLPAHTPRLARVSPPVQPEIETQDRVETRREILMANRTLAGGWRKNPDRALFYRRRRPAGGLRAKVDWQDVWKVIRDYNRWRCSAPLGWLSSAT